MKVAPEGMRKEPVERKEGKRDGEREGGREGWFQDEGTCVPEDVG